jgi:hypothetical protein
MADFYEIPRTADGHAVYVNDVLYTRNGLEVQASEIIATEHGFFVRDTRNLAGGRTSVEQLYTYQRDSLKCIKRDATVSPRFYCKRFGVLPNVEDPDAADYEEAKALDLVNRCETLFRQLSEPGDGTDAD